MALSESTRQRLTQALEERTAAAAESLLAEQDPAAAKAHLEWMETAGRLLATGARPARTEPIYRAGIIGLVCVTLLLLAWSLKVGNNALRLELRVAGLSFSLPDGWNLGDSGAVAASRVNGLRFRRERVPDVISRSWDRDETVIGCC